MQFREAAHEVLAEVERVTGHPVEVIDDPDLPYLARITRATGAAPAHLLRVNPTKGEPDYLIVYEAGFLLRLYRTSA